MNREPEPDPATPLRWLAAVCGGTALVLALDTSVPQGPAWFAPLCAAGAFLLSILVIRRR